MREKLLAGCLFVSTLGCGSMLPSSEATTAAAKHSGSEDRSVLAKARLSAADESVLTRAARPATLPAETPSDSDSSAEGMPLAERKIIYRAELDLMVDDFDQTELAAPRLVAEHGGYLANVELTRNTGDNRHGRWTIRVPVDRFESLLDAVSQLGVPTRRQQSGQDVSEEYIDLEARLLTKKKFEERLIKLVEDRTDNVKDLIVVEQQLARVRTEIEQMQGRLRYLQNQTSMTTVTLTAQEQHNYTPPETPGLGSRIATTWNGSLGSMQNVGAGVVLASVSAAPWLLMVGVVVGPAWMLRRRSTTKQEA